jgi:hypothetical protein
MRWVSWGFWRLGNGIFEWGNLPFQKRVSGRFGFLVSGGRFRLHFSLHADGRVGKFFFSRSYPPNQVDFRPSNFRVIRAFRGSYF